MENQQIQQAERLANYCKSFNKTIDLLVDSQDGYEKYFQMFCFLNKKDLNLEEFTKLCEKNSYFEFFHQVLSYVVSKSKKFDFKSAKPVSYSKLYDKTSLNERRIFFLVYTLKIINLIAPISIGLRKFLNEKNGLKALLTLIEQEDFIDQLDKYDQNSLENIIININFLTKTFDILVHGELNIVDILLKYIKIFSRAKIYALMALSNVANDKEIESISQFGMLIDALCEMAIRCIYSPDSTSKQEIIDDFDQSLHSTEVKAVVDIFNKRTHVSLLSILLVLYKISINGRRKKEIYEKNGFNDALLKIIYQGNDVEKQYALELLTQLCFDNNVFKSVQGDTELYKYIQNLSISRDIKFKKLIYTCNQFLCLFKQKKQQVEITTPKSDQHIMISYNSASRDTCLRIKSYLEGLNFKVWIDVEQIHGSSVDSMAKAVEDAEIFLMCVTEKYRQSSNCQSEAQYAFRLNKPIIPCIMQKGFNTVGGWLGFIIGDKIFVDFTKYNLEESLKRVSDQITHLKKTIEQVEGDSSFTKNRLQQWMTLSPASTWDEIKTEEWFVQNSFEEIFKGLKPINGKNLYELYQLQVNTPDYFYKSLAKNESVDINKLIRFITALKDLFDK